MKVAITGATGFIGRALIEFLQNHGHQCTALSRDPQRAARAGFPDGVVIASADELPETDAVIHLAGENPAGLWTGAKRRAITQSRVITTRRLITAMEGLRVRPRVFLCASAVGFYGNRPGEDLDENSAPDPDESFRSRVCLQWEAEAAKAAAAGTRVVELRIANVMDPSDGYFARFAKLFHVGLAFNYGNPAGSLSWVSLEDCVRLITFALEESTLSGPMNIVAPNPTHRGAVTAALARYSRRGLRGTIPGWVLRAMLGELSTAVLDEQRIFPRRAMDAGFVFRHPAWRAWVDACL